MKLKNVTSATSIASQKSTWAKELSQGLISTNQLLAKKLIQEKDIPVIQKTQKFFSTRVPQQFVSEIQNQEKSISNQFIPSESELHIFPEELEDPIGDKKHEPIKGIVHRYPNRVLFKPTLLCAVYCRFCFRKNQVSHCENNLHEKEILSAMEYIKNHTEIWEVIVTGGDPLVLTDKQLENIILLFNDIPHLKIIRFHTRIFTVLPSRINETLLNIFQKSKHQIWMVCHINSHAEFTDNAKDAIKFFSKSGFPILLQSVLLKNVNDSFEQLKLLFETAVENSIKPYYLHYLDLAQGTEHFRVELEEALHLYENLRGKLSGLCIPDFMLDLPQGLGKISLKNSPYKKINSTTWEFQSPLTKETVIVTYPKKNSPPTNENIL